MVMLTPIRNERMGDYVISMIQRQFVNRNPQIFDIDMLQEFLTFFDLFLLISLYSFV